jgi:hypothetical protein
VKSGLRRGAKGLFLITERYVEEQKNIMTSQAATAHVMIPGPINEE